MDQQHPVYEKVTGFDIVIHVFDRAYDHSHSPAIIRSHSAEDTFFEVWVAVGFHFEILPVL